MGQVGSSGPWSSSRHCHRGKGVSSPYGLCERISILSPLERTVGRIERACPPRIIYSASRRSVSLSLSLHLPNTHPRKHEDAFASLSNPLPKPTRRCLVSSKVKWEAGETQADIFFSREVSRIFTSHRVVRRGDCSRHPPHRCIQARIQYSNIARFCESCFLVVVATSVSTTNSDRSPSFPFHLLVSRKTSLVVLAPYLFR